MPESMTLIEREFSALIRTRAVPFGDMLTLHAEGDAIYIIDPDTYELREVLSNSPQQFIPGGKDWRGEKCYAYLQGFDKPCLFCTNHLLRHDSYHVWQHRNPITGRNYILKDKLVHWQGQKLRMEVAIDAEDHSRLSDVLFESLSWDNQMLACIRILRGPDAVRKTLLELIQSLCRYFDASSGYVALYSGEEDYNVVWSRDGRYPGPCVLGHPSDAARAEWAELYETHSQLLVPDIASLDEAPTLRDACRASNVSSATSVPLRLDGRLIGMLGLNNIGLRHRELAMLEMLEEPIIHKLREAQLQQRAERLQYADPLTGGLNLTGFRRRVEDSLARFPEKKFAVCYCDIKKFKYINDAFGYEVGDGLLRFWAGLFLRTQREGDAFCRISGDTFAALRGYEDLGDLMASFRQGAQRLYDYEDLARRHIHPEVATGLYLIEKPEDRLPLNAMLDRANIVQKRIKRLPGSNVSFYSDDMRAETLQELTLLADAEEGLRLGEFQPYFQQQVDIRRSTGDTMLAEVLVRWKSARQGRIIPPNDFIPLFERNGLIVELDRAVFQSACTFLHEMLRSSEVPLRLSINVSRITALQPDFVAEYTRIRDAYAIPKGCIELEFTESLAVENMEHFAEITSALRKAGFRCAMDDFGEGYSSLTALHTLPLDTLKLDRGFFRSLCDDPRTQTLVSNILRMGRELNMEVIAEGIETIEQVELLKGLGCPYIQGYVFARPVPSDEFRACILAKDRGTPQPPSTQRQA